MAKLIKKGTVDLGTSLEGGGDVDPNSGFVERSTSQKVISGEKFTAKAEAERIVQKAEAEAAEIIAQAQAQAQQIVAQGQTQAAALQEQVKEAGMKEGRAEGAAQLTETIAMPGGTIQPFCEPVKTTSRSHASIGADMSTSSNPNTDCAWFIADKVVSRAGNTLSTSQTAI